MSKIVIIGAGVSGVYLSILLKQNHHEVIVLEQNATSLKKLLATGNGRCNLSNEDMDVQYYQSDNQKLVDMIIHDFDVHQAMNELGLMTTHIGNLVYPHSEQAQSVKRIFMDRALELGVQFIYEQEVLEVDPYQNIIKTNKQIYHYDDVVLAMGSEAGKLSGINQSRYDILRKLHLKVIEPTPSLTQMYTKPVYKSLKGVRVKGTFTLLENNQIIKKEHGELLFTDYGVSGIAVMQLSSFILAGHRYQLSIDFFPEKDKEKLCEYIELQKNKAYNHVYDGLLPIKLAQLLENKGISDIGLLKDFRLNIEGLRNYETAQVMKGGLSLKEVNQYLELVKYPHIYAIGEILNVAGVCGGYNLHFALACAWHVNEAIERNRHVKNT
ncbi:MAG: aminoacetone oxidase family FAD-binding enzyme [Erysipelotrichaceae bacterium]|nr:aminoacetone oxidase family FAD-binding enzyme [Erysipelotrichaceae bacterium]